MLDMHDKPVTEGARCRFFAETRDTWVEGVVRKVATNGFFLGQARVDDGDPAVSDPRRNRLTTRRRVHSEDIEVVRE